MVLEASAATAAGTELRGFGFYHALNELRKLPFWHLIRYVLSTLFIPVRTGAVQLWHIGTVIKRLFFKGSKFGFLHFSSVPMLR